MAKGSLHIGKIRTVTAIIVVVVISSFAFLSLSLWSSSLERDSSAVTGLDECQKNRAHQRMRAKHVMVF